MTASFAYPERVPLNAVERLQRDFSNLLADVRNMLDVVPSDTPDAALCQRAHILLQEEQQALKREAEEFQSGSREALLEHASKLRLLARNMDGYTVTGADDALAADFVKHRRLVVLTAWQIAGAASGSEAAGL